MNGYVAQGHSSTDWELLFAGYRFDANDALYVIRRRVYNHAIGSWLSRDPLIVFRTVTQLYAYVNANPIITVDPSGLAAQQAIPAECKDRLKPEKDVCKIIIFAGHHVPSHGFDDLPEEFDPDQHDELEHWFDELQKMYKREMEAGADENPEAGAAAKDGGKTVLPCSTYVAGVGCFMGPLYNNLTGQFGEGHVITLPAESKKLPNPTKPLMFPMATGALITIYNAAKEQARAICKEQKKNNFKCCKKVKIIICCSPDYTNVINAEDKKKKKAGGVVPQLCSGKDNETDPFKNVFDCT